MTHSLNGMILWSTLVLTVILAGLWLSLEHGLILLNKVTFSLEENRKTTTTIEREAWSFLKKTTAQRLNACTQHACFTELGFPVTVQKEVCDACLSFSFEPGLQGTQHWFVSIDSADIRLTVRWATLAACGPCKKTTVLLDSALLNWYLYP